MSESTRNEARRFTPDQFAKVAGSPGETPRLVGWARVLMPFLLLFFLVGYLVRAAWPVPPLNTTAIGAGFLALAGLLAWSVTVGRQRLDSFIKGARGEEWVARTLSYLPATFHVYHGIRDASGWLKEGGDYDHVVVGPTGIFLVETKYWSGRITVQDGRILCNDAEPDRPPLDQVKEAAARLRRDLREAVHRNIEVQPVLCFAGGVFLEGRGGASGVIICSGHTLLDVLQEPSDTPIPKDVQVKTAQHLRDKTGGS